MCCYCTQTTRMGPQSNKLKVIPHEFGNDHFILNSLNTELCCIPFLYWFFLYGSQSNQISLKKILFLNFRKTWSKPPSLQKRSYEVTPVHLSVCLPLRPSVMYFSQDLLLIYNFCKGIFLPSVLKSGKSRFWKIVFVVKIDG